MTKTVFTFCAVVAGVTVLHAFRGLRTGTISGTVVPSDEVMTVTAIKGADSAKSILSEGAFALTVKPGNWKVIVNARSPYKGVIIENIHVTPDNPINIGDIHLQQ